MTDETNRFQIIKDLVEERDRFLAENPELNSLQDEINEVLLKAGNNQQQRQQKIQEMLLNTWFEITKICL